MENAILLGILSDTHGNVPRTQSAVRMFQSLGVEQVIHCGDIGTPEIVALLARWPAHFVFGNVDSPGLLQRAIRESGGICHGQIGTLDLEAKRIAFLHGDDSRLLESVIVEGRWDLVCHGHTHMAGHHCVGRTMVLNPGALHRTAHPSVAVVELPSLEITSVSIG
ncbi:MAG: metallophosphoesterase family protein [Thermoguttaceae bacterium]